MRRRTALIAALSSLLMTLATTPALAGGNLHG